MAHILDDLSDFYLDCVKLPTRLSIEVGRGISDSTTLDTQMAVRAEVVCAIPDIPLEELKKFDFPQHKLVVDRFSIEVV